MSSEYPDQTRLRQTGAHCSRGDSRLGGGTLLADRDVTMSVTPHKCFPDLTDKSPKIYLRVLKVLNLTHFK